MGFGQGLSGLNAASQNLDVIGNNIANSGTVGFKSGSATFSDVYANSRVGLGVQLASINQRFTSGTVSTTGNQFDMAIDLTTGHAGLVALAEAMRRWIFHVLGVDVTIEPLSELREVNLAWYVGLDADATKIGDMMWNGEEIDETTLSRVVGLFALTFRDPSLVLDRVRGEPVYLILAMTPEKTIRMKPQNLSTGLPIRHLEAVS